jgi:hypothetical protein
MEYIQEEADFSIRVRMNRKLSLKWALAEARKTSGLYIKNFSSHVLMV